MIKYLCLLFVGLFFSGSTSESLPSEVLELTNWKITLPISKDGKKEGSPMEVEQPLLKSYNNKQYFYVNPDKTGVVFRADVGGVTTEGSKYPRSELREMTNNGKANANWASSSGVHTLEIEQAVIHLPKHKPQIVLGQIHNDKEYLIFFRLEDKKLFVEHNGTRSAPFTDNYTLGTKFKVKFVVEHNKVKSYYNDELKETYDKSFTHAYFKAGAYVQSSCKIDKEEPCDSFGEVIIYKLSAKHQN